MYLETGAVAPYCKHHYLLQLHLAKPRQAEAWVQVCHIQLHFFVTIESPINLYLFV